MYEKVFWISIINVVIKVCGIGIMDVVGMLFFLVGMVCDGNCMCGMLERCAT